MPATLIQSGQHRVALGGLVGDVDRRPSEGERLRRAVAHHLVLLLVRILRSRDDGLFLGLVVAQGGRLRAEGSAALC
eukprot:13253375-Alexandrium_andersonii.AAC.1